MFSPALAVKPAYLIPKSIYAPVFAITLGLSMFVAGPAQGQISGTYDYDASNRAYFIIGNTSIDGNISVNPNTGLPFTDSPPYNGNDVFVGKDNAIGFKTLGNPIVVTVNGAINGEFGNPVGAMITYANSSYPYSNSYDPNAAKYHGLNVFGGHTANVKGGSLIIVSSRDNGTINISGGRMQSAVAYDAGIVNISGGTLTAGAIGKNSGTINVNGGFVANTDSYDGSTINITAGTVSTASALDNSSTVNINGGSVGTAKGYRAGTLNIYQGSLTSVQGNATSTVNIKGSSISSLQGLDSSLINLSGGSVSTATISNTSVINVSGGLVTNLYGRSSGRLNISGGAVTDIYQFDNSVLNITGGKIGKNTIRLFNNSTLNLFGTGLSYSFAVSGTDANGSYNAYTLFGTLLNGDSIDGVTIRDYDGGSSVGDPNNGTGSLRFFAAVVPEPGTLALIGLTLPASIGFLLRRRMAARI